MLAFAVIHLPAITGICVPVSDFTLSWAIKFLHHCDCYLPSNRRQIMKRYVCLNVIGAKTRDLRCPLFANKDKQPSGERDSTSQEGAVTRTVMLHWHRCTCGLADSAALFLHSQHSLYFFSIKGKHIQIGTARFALPLQRGGLVRSLVCRQHGVSESAGPSGAVISPTRSHPCSIIANFFLMSDISTYWMTASLSFFF